MLKVFAKSYEELQRHIMMACSHAQQKQVQNTLSILDMTKFGLSALNRTKGLIKAATGIMQDNYPENLGKSYIVNTPMVFQAAWKIVKVFLDERTVAKISLHRYMDCLKEEIDED